MHAEVRRPLRWRRWLLSRPTAGLALLAFVSWEALQGRYSTASHVSILVAVAVVVLVALVGGRRKQHERSATWLRDVGRVGRVGRVPRELWTARRPRSAAVAGVLGWTLLIAATVAWDLFTFVVQRQSLPTLSRLFGDVTRYEWGRGVVFCAWVALGLYLALGWRQPPRARRATTPHGPGLHERAR